MTSGTEEMGPDTHYVENRSELPKIKRYVTTKDADGLSRFSTEIPPEIPWTNFKDAAQFGVAYTSTGLPVDLKGDKDIQNYQNVMKNGLTLAQENGTVLRIVDMTPGHSAPMHLTKSIDYGVVLEGQVEAIMDSGETRICNRGDIVVQRNTNHSWRNCSPTQTARMLYVLIDSTEL